MFTSLPWSLQIFLLVLYYSFRAFLLTGVFFYIFSTAWGKNRKMSSKPYTAKQIKFETVQTLKTFVLDSILLVALIKIGLFKVVHLSFLADLISFLI